MIGSAPDLGAGLATSLRTYSRQAYFWVSVLAGFVLLGLRVVEQQVPAAAVWVFVFLSLTMGTLHGAADVVLLLDDGEFDAAWAKKMAAYFTCVVGLAMFLHGRAAAALAVLLLASAWHFGEHAADSIADGALSQQVESLARRLGTAAAPLAVPYYLHLSALEQVLRQYLGLSGPEVKWVLIVWQGVSLLGGLCALGLLVVRVVQVARVGGPWTDWRSVLVRDWMLCLTLYGLHSPLMAFSLYFGIYHASEHLHKVFRDGQLAGAPRLWALGCVLLLSLALFAAFAWLTLSGVSLDVGPSLLGLLVVALTAVTLVHMGVVWRWRHFRLRAQI